MLRYMTAGESHGKAIMAILDGVPAGLLMDEGFINKELAKRMQGYGRGRRMKIEKDKVDIIAGCCRGITIASPIGMIIYNRSCKIDILSGIKCPRPGHADLAGLLKYNFDDARNVLERASARETAARVAVGAVAKLILREFGVKVLSHVTRIGQVKAVTRDLSFEEISSLAEKSILRCADIKATRRMRAEIDLVKQKGDTLGGVFEIIAQGVPPGLGTYAQWDRRMDGILANLLMSIPAVKAVSIGSGIECAGKRGSETHDEIIYDSREKMFSRTSNNAGGIEGGITNGMPVVIEGFMKPIATLGVPLKSVDIDTKKECAAQKERADTVAVGACAVVAESMTAFGIASCFLEKFGGDSLSETRRNYKAYMDRLVKL